MPNRPTIDIFERKDLRTDAVDYVVNVYDNYNSTNLIFAEKSNVPDDDMELLTEIIRSLNHSVDHGSSTMIVQAILDYVKEYEIAIRIGDTRYEWDEIKETMRYAFRNLYECPKCGHTSWDDDCGDCPDCDGGQMQFVNEENFEL